MTPRTAARQASLSFTISRSLLKLTPIESAMHPTVSSSIVPFSSCLQSFSASGSFLMSQLFLSGGHSIGASASVLLMTIQYLFPLGWTGLILQSNGHELGQPHGFVFFFFAREKCAHKLFSNINITINSFTDNFHYPSFTIPKPCQHSKQKVSCIVKRRQSSDYRSTTTYKENISF